MSPDLAAGRRAPPETLPVVALRRDGGTQPRVGLDERTVAEYAEAMVAGASFPPAVVFFDGAAYWRAAAAERAGQLHLRVDVHPGGPREAQLWAAGANATHGLRRTNADKRRAVALLLHDEEWGRWGDREIARRCGVSHTFVSNLRAEPSGNGCHPAELMDAAEARRLTDEVKADLARLSEEERERFFRAEAILEAAPRAAVHYWIERLAR